MRAPAVAWRGTAGCIRSRHRRAAGQRADVGTHGDPRYRNEAASLLLRILDDHYHEAQLLGLYPRMRTREEGSNMASESVAETVTPTDVGLKRELGLIGATWASETSIIGSGWLYAPLTAALLIGGAAVLDWVIAGIVVILLALCHAELGAMHPVSGGTARFPHFAFGSVAGIGFGFFAYVQAVTIAPIECYAFIQYAAHFWPSIYDSKAGNVTGVGFVLTIVLMAIFVAVNFLAM